MAKSRQDVVGVNYVKEAHGKVLVENDQVKEEWRKYMKNCGMRRTHGIMSQPVIRYRDP